MQCVIKGHFYALENFELANGADSKYDEPRQTIQFIEKEPVTDGSLGELRTVKNGTTNEEVLSVLIDRLQYLQGKFPCRENALATTKLQEAKFWLRERTEERLKRGVEGKYLP